MWCARAWGATGADVRLRQLQGLALARSGALERASEILEQLRAEKHADEETLGMLARTYKDRAAHASKPGERRKSCARRRPPTRRPIKSRKAIGPGSTRPRPRCSSAKQSRRDSGERSARGMPARAAADKRRSILALRHPGRSGADIARMGGSGGLVCARRRDRARTFRRPAFQPTECALLLAHCR